MAKQVPEDVESVNPGVCVLWQWAKQTFVLASTVRPRRKTWNIPLFAVPCVFERGTFGM